MNERKMFSLSYFLGRVFFLGFGISLLSKITTKDTWIAAVLGTILGSGLIFFFNYLRKKVNGTILNQKNSILKGILTTLFFLFNLFVFSQIIFIFQTFASSFFLIKSPNFFITLPIPFIIYRICKNGLPTIAKVGEILMPISLFLILFSFLGLLNHMKLDNFTPVLTTEPLNLIQGTLFYAFYSSAPFILLMNAKSEEHHLVRKYIFSSLTIILIIITTVGVLGANLVQIYRYPEYMVLKKIKLFNFIEKVENIVSISWLFDLFMTLSITGHNIKECLPEKKKNLLFILILILLYFGAILCGIYYQEELMLYHILPIILGISEILILICFYFFSRVKKKS